MPVHSQEIPREDNGEAQSPFMWWIQLILISQLQPPPPQTPPCPNMKIVASELLICLDLFWLVGSMICKSNNWTESGWYPLEWLNIVHTGNRLIDAPAAPMDVEMYIINVWDCDTYSCSFAAFAYLWPRHWKSNQVTVSWFKLMYLTLKMFFLKSMTKIFFCASKSSTSTGEWNYENLLCYLMKYMQRRI